MLWCIFFFFPFFPSSIDSLNKVQEVLANQMSWCLQVSRIDGFWRVKSTWEDVEPHLSFSFSLMALWCLAFCTPFIFVRLFACVFYLLINVFYKEALINNDFLSLINFKINLVNGLFFLSFFHAQYFSTIQLCISEGFFKVIK